MYHTDDWTLETRKTYRAVFSEPVLILPPDGPFSRSEEQTAGERPVELVKELTDDTRNKNHSVNTGENGDLQVNTKKRPMEDEVSASLIESDAQTLDGGPKRKKKRKNKESFVAVS